MSCHCGIVTVTGNVLSLWYIYSHSNWQYPVIVVYIVTVNGHVLLLWYRTLWYMITSGYKHIPFSLNPDSCLFTSLWRHVPMLAYVILQVTQSEYVTSRYIIFTGLSYFSIVNEFDRVVRMGYKQAHFYCLLHA